VCHVHARLPGVCRVHTHHTCRFAAASLTCMHSNVGLMIATLLQGMHKCCTRDADCERTLTVRCIYALVLTVLNLGSLSVIQRTATTLCL
jgi:hypothetical protein